MYVFNLKNPVILKDNLMWPHVIFVSAALSGWFPSAKWAVTNKLTSFRCLHSTLYHCQAWDRLPALKPHVRSQGTWDTFLQPCLILGFATETVTKSFSLLSSETLQNQGWPALSDVDLLRTVSTDDRRGVIISING